MAAYNTTVRINGVDFSDIIHHEGKKWRVYKLSPPDTTRTLDGMMHKTDVANKRAMTFTLSALTPPSRFRDLHQALLIERMGVAPLTVEYMDPGLGAMATKTFYCSSLEGTEYPCATAPEGAWIQEGSFSIEEY